MDADAEFQEFLAGVQALRDGRVGGVEVAVAALPSIGQMLVAGLVQPEGGNLSLEVARWVADEQGLGSRVAAERTLKLETAEEFRAAQRLLEQAEAVLPERRGGGQGGGGFCPPRGGPPRPPAGPPPAPWG